MASTAASGATPAHTSTAASHNAAVVTTGRSTGERGHQQSLGSAGFDGMAVAAIGTGLTGAGWLLMLVASRQLRRRSR
jgi:hypothetical protein